MVGNYGVSEEIKLCNVLDVRPGLISVGRNISEPYGD